MAKIQWIILLVETVLCSEFKFPVDFEFGVATAAYQIEGAWNVSGKSQNIWDHLTHNHPSWVKDHSNGDIACDSYHRYKIDVAAMKSLGVQFYRFSLSWTRLFPDGFTNRINAAGVSYYNNLIDEVLRNGLKPVVTLYHWDLPQCFQDLGGWSNEIMVNYFYMYAATVFRLFGDKVKMWITFNEPLEICESGYGQGDDAPALSYSGTADYLCGRTLLLAHARVYRLYQDVFYSTQQGKVGITMNTIWAEPKDNTTVNRNAADRYLQMNFGWWAHPIFSKNGSYPIIMRTRISYLSIFGENFTHSRLPEFSKDEVQLIRGTYDFMGLNHYSTWLVSDYERPLHSKVSHDKDVGVGLEQDPKWKPSSLNWLKVVPWGLRKILNWIKIEYGNPLVYITENGFSDVGGLDDYGRIEYHREYLKALLKAVVLDNCNVKGYTVWSLIDNMEWREGYTAKFGLFQVNFTDPLRKRTPKKSSKYYKQVIHERVP